MRWPILKQSFSDPPKTIFSPYKTFLIFNLYKKNLQLTKDVIVMIMESVVKV
jgi:hypothetical protein